MSYLTPLPIGMCSKHRWHLCGSRERANVRIGASWINPSSLVCVSVSMRMAFIEIFFGVTRQHLRAHPQPIVTPPAKAVMLIA